MCKSGSIICKDCAMCEQHDLNLKLGAKFAMQTLRTALKAFIVIVISKTVIFLINFIFLMTNINWFGLVSSGRL